jgi:hypothetical protein
MIDRRKSAPLQLESAEKLESGQVEEGQVRACQIGAGQVRAGSGQGESGQGESGGGAADSCRDFLCDVTSLQVADA